MGFEKLESLNLETFTPHLHTRFRVRFGPQDGVTELELIEASENEPRHAGGASRLECFELIFRAPHDCPPQQGLYDFEHDVLGEVQLFIVPVGKDKEGIYFQSLFTRLIEQ